MLSTKLCGITLKNPLILASGILGISKNSVEKIASCGAGAATLKSICHEERKGHPAPNMFVFEGGMLNAVGLPGQGIKSAKKDFGTLDDCSIPIIASTWGYSVEQFIEVAEAMAELNPAMIELDVSCPHTDYDEPFYASKELLSNIIKGVKKKTTLPISVKLSPNVHNIAELAKCAEDAGADCITAINTANAMMIDIEVSKPILGNKSGGLSGPALKPIAVKCVYDIYKAVSIPIIGTGGITTAQDAIEMIMAGATALGIGTACYYEGPEIFSKISKDMQQWLTDHNIKSLNDIRGIAHD